LNSTAQFPIRVDANSSWTLPVILAGAALVGFAIGGEYWYIAVPLAISPLLLLRPIEIALGLFAVLLPFERVATLGGQSSTGAGTTLNYYVGLAAGVTLLATGLATGSLRASPRAAYWWGGLIFWSICTMIWAVDPGSSRERIPTALALLLLYALSVSLEISEKQLNWIMGCTIFGGVIAALLACSQFVNGVTYFGRASLMIGGRATDPNVFAACVLLPLSLAAGAFFGSRRQVYKVASFFAFALILISVLLSMSRGAIVAVAAMLFVFLRRYRVSPRVIAAMAVLPLLGLLLPSMFFQRLQHGISSRGEGRFDIWMVGLAAFREWGLQGAGLENFTTVYQKYSGVAPVFRGYNMEPHNVYLLIGVELGVVGLFLFANAARIQLRAASQLYAEGPPRALLFAPAVACEAACWGMLIMGFSLGVLWLKAFWFSFALLAISIRIGRRQSRECAR